MRKNFLTVALICTLCGALTLPSCIGSFGLTNKLLTWNRHIDNKFVNELVFFAFWILPVYEVSGLADLLVLNSIEFWSGTNPVTKEKKIVKGNDGRYIVECDGKGYTITSENDGSVARLDFNEEERSWSYVVDGERHTLFTFVDDTHVKMPAPDGTFMTVELSDNGVLAYQHSVMGATLAMR